MASDDEETVSPKDELKTLISRRGTVKASVTRLRTYVDNFKKSKNISIYQLKSRLTHLQNLFNNFCSLQDQIEQLDSPSKQGKEREDFETNYYDIESEILEIIDKATNKNVTQASASSNPLNANQTGNVRLPMLNLPTFDGNYLEWTSFRDTYKALIHDCSLYTDIEKFHYLKSCLKNEALRSIEPAIVSGDNYESAWTNLEKRYENKRILAQEHVMSIVNSPNIVKNSHLSLRNLYDNISINLAALKALEQPTEHWDTLLIPIISSKFDFLTKREWESKLNSDIPKIAELYQFLEKRCTLVEALNTSTDASRFNQPTKSANSNRNSSNIKSRAVFNNVSSSKSPECYLCKKSHSLFHCPEFLNLAVTERINRVNTLKLCLNCFKNNHVVENCKSSSSCKQCKSRHNTLLHKEQPAASIGSIVTHINNSKYTETLLSTAEIMVKNQSGLWQKCRALLDPGSQLNFVTSALLNTLQLDRKTVDWPIEGVNDTQSNARQLAKIQIRSIHSNFNSTIECLVLLKVTPNLPLFSFDIEQLQLPSNIKLADENFNISSSVDILLGAQVFWAVLEIGQIKATKYNPHIQETSLGWVIGGNLALPSTINRSVCNLSLNNLNKQISRFWELDEYQSSKVPQTKYSDEDLQCETFFEKTTRRTTHGRFSVRLPFKNDPSQIGNTRQMAIKRLISLENKFKREPELKIRYTEFMTEYIELGHMTLISQSNIEENFIHLPHHGVIKESSTTTKLRAVFDASARSLTGVSLNDVLATGPKIQNDLIPILLRFRLHQYVFTADINKMYRQILVAPEDRKYQTIVWRENSSQNIETFQLNRIAYGLSCAPYLAVKCLQTLANELKHKYPETYQILLEDFYMDDVLTGADDLNTAIKIRKELTSLLKEGCFELRKFASNEPNLLPNVTENATTDSHTLNLDKNWETKTLGLIWNCREDNLRYQIDIGTSNTKSLTKREILSSIAKIYDPLQSIGPVIVKAKILMQNLWKLKLGWDENVPDEIDKFWREFTKQLNALHEFRIPRKIISTYPYTKIEMHGFADASQAAYGACIYIRSMGQDNTVSTHLLCAKSRVAPLKTISIPRLELCAAVLLTKLISKTIGNLKIQINNIIYWTDSTIVLSWLNTSPHSLKTFVANRVTEIQNNSVITNWRHVNSSSNPADLISRGLLPQELKAKSDMWFHGPTWLQLNVDHWPPNYVSYNEQIPETRKITLTTVHKDNEIHWWNKYSSFIKLVRVIAWCLRWVNNIKNKTKQMGNLKLIEIKTATCCVLKTLQNLEFHKELKDLQNKKEIHIKSKLKTLSPFLDNVGLIRVGGRLKNSDLDYNQKYPVVLPKHFVTELIIKEEHELQLHAGPSATLAAIRQKYWPLDGRNQTRKIIRKCMTCFRVNPTEVSAKMGNLPTSQVTASRPFSNCGVDYAGPILIKQGDRRSKRFCKSYICLFICFATKAIHLELVLDLTSESFVNALKRFIARRGIVNNIYSDNATNFHGAQKELKELFQSAKFNNQVNDYLTKIGIQWHFIPARSPHFGGIWEASIKSTKSHMKRVVANAKLTYEEMHTLLAGIEACLNSRPLCPLNSDPNDYSTLTPGHFLIGSPLTASPEPELLDVPDNRLSRWQHLEKIKQHFWQRWTVEYLSQLQQRNKWCVQKNNAIKEGCLVLMKESSPPLVWKRGRVIQTHAGSDGIIRVVTVKTNTGTFKRDIKSVCVLPCSDTENQ